MRKNYGNNGYDIKVVMEEGITGSKNGRLEECI